MPGATPLRFAVCLVLAGVACTADSTVSQSRSTAASPPTTAPTQFTAAGLSSASRQSLIAYGQSLMFRQDPTAGDAQYVYEDTATYIRVSSEMGSRTITREQLGQGRIIAQINSTGLYRRLGIGRGLNYLWIDSVGARGNAWRAVMIPTDTSVPLKRLGFKLVTNHAIDSMYGKEPLARILVAMKSIRVPSGTSPKGSNAQGGGEGLESLWGTCSNGCCIACNGLETLALGGLVSEFTPAQIREALDGLASDTCDGAVEALSAMSMAARGLPPAMISKQLAFTGIRPIPSPKAGPLTDRAATPARRQVAATKPTVRKGS